VKRGTDAVLHALRDRLMPAEATQAAAQLPARAQGDPDGGGADRRDQVRLQTAKLRSLPVIDAESQVVGMVSRNDLMGAIAPEQL
jgi:uncharacterized protein (DUF2267 family)